MNEWMAYYQIEPFGQERADLRMGILAAVMAGPHRRKGQRPPKPRDFMPRFDYDIKVHSAAEIKNKLKLFARQHNQALEHRRRKP